MYNAELDFEEQKQTKKLVVLALNAHQNMYIFICKYCVILV